MNRIKSSLLTLFVFLMLIIGVSAPVSAKHTRYHHVRISRKARKHHRRYRRHRRKYRKRRRYRKHRHYYKKKRKLKRKTVSKPVARYSKRDFDDINRDRQANYLPKLAHDKSLQKIAIDRVNLAYKAWQHNWNSHGSDGKTKTAAQLAFDNSSADYSPTVLMISENNAKSYLSSIPATSSMVDGRMNYFPPDDVSTPDNIVDTNNDIYMNHDVGADGQSGHRANILGTGVNAVGTAVCHKDGCYVQDEVFGLVY